jgi:hypothetical protein
LTITLFMSHEVSPVLESSSMVMTLIAGRVARHGATRSLTRRWLSSDSSALVHSSMKSVRVRVTDDLELHAIVPKENDHATARGQTPVLCLPSAFGGCFHQT